MSGQNRHGSFRLVERARDSAIFVICRLWPGQNFDSIEAKFDQHPARVQGAITFSVLGFLLLLALFAGQFGPLGVMLYFAAVLITLR